MVNRTKEAIITAFGELLEERPLNKITVKDVVDRCQISRNTFYYHFEGIPSLLEETVRDMSDQVIRSHGKLGSLSECIAPIVHYCTAHKRAILHIYRSVRRDVFLSHLDRIAIHAVDLYVETVTADPAHAEGWTEEKRLLSRYFKCALVGSLLDWLDAGMSYDLLEFVSRISQLFDGAGEKALRRCAADSRKPS